MGQNLTGYNFEFCALTPECFGTIGSGSSRPSRQTNSPCKIHPGSARNCPKSSSGRCIFRQPPPPQAERRSPREPKTPLMRHHLYSPMVPESSVTSPHHPGQRLCPGTILHLDQHLHNSNLSHICVPAPWHSSHHHYFIGSTPLLLFCFSVCDANIDLEMVSSRCRQCELLLNHSPLVCLISNPQSSRVPKIRLRQRSV